MPELPEVECAARGLSNLVLNQKILEIDFHRSDLRDPMPMDEIRNILVGQVVQAADGAFEAILAAEFQRLELLRIIRFSPAAPIQDPDRLIGPLLSPETENIAEAGDG